MIRGAEAVGVRVLLPERLKELVCGRAFELKFGPHFFFLLKHAVKLMLNAEATYVFKHKALRGADSLASLRVVQVDLFNFAREQVDLVHGQSRLLLEVLRGFLKWSDSLIHYLLDEPLHVFVVPARLKHDVLFVLSHLLNLAYAGRFHHGSTTFNRGLNLSNKRHLF